MRPGFAFTTVIVSTFNRPSALQAVLSAFDRQTDRAFEVVVADDGSDDRTTAVVESRRQAAPYDLIHAWQEDDGFRLARARNLAAGRARGDYLIFLDGDCIPRSNFIARHRQLAEEGWFVRGTRAAMTQRFTDRVLSEGMAVDGWSVPRWLWATVQRDLKDPSPLLNWPGKGLRKWHPTRWRGAQGCNLGVPRAAFERVNGLDEVYVGWGMEDADLAIRLIRSGVFRKEGKFATAVLHLWHPQNDRSALEENEARFQETLKSNRIRARRGLSSHASESY